MGEYEDQLRRHRGISVDILPRGTTDYGQIRVGFFDGLEMDPIPSQVIAEPVDVMAMDVRIGDGGDRLSIVVSMRDDGEMTPSVWATYYPEDGEERIIGEIDLSDIPGLRESIR